MITNENIVYIKELIAAHPRASRRRLSQKLCEAWQWKQPNGALRDMVCRGLLLTLHRAGQIELPPVRYVPHNPLARRVQPAPVLIDTTPMEGRLGQFQPLEFAQVRRSGDEPLFNSLLEEHHYLGYEQPVGEHLKYLVWAQGRPLACVAWSSAPRHIGGARPLHRLEPGGAAPQHPVGRLQHTVSDSALGAGAASGVAHSGPDGRADLR